MRAAFFLLLLAGCATPPPPSTACPPLAPISAELQAQAADELEAPPLKPALTELMGMFAQLRDQVRACRR